MTIPPERRSPMTEATEWVSRILAVAAVMVLPLVGGAWLDKQLGTRFLGLVGIALGVTSGIVYLLALTKQPPRGGNRTTDGD
ncbi:MAG TPA: hypothetical protein VHC19_22920 [Pirellulales bacterium]|nr:hypothetical protein [Pirellulales bacterium]